jgi:hypothetical protein
MTRILSSKLVCATMFLLFALAVMANSFAGGALPTFGGSPVLATQTSQLQVAHADEVDSPIFPPDPYDRDTDGNPPQLAHGSQASVADATEVDSPIFPPDPYDRDTDGNPPQLARS